MKSFYINGTVITMEDDALYAEAVCAENGKIFAVGDQDEIMKLYKEQDEIIDLHGGTLLPGFIDGHSHFVGVANAMRQCDLSSCESFQNPEESFRRRMADRLQLRSQFFEGGAPPQQRSSGSDQYGKSGSFDSRILPYGRDKQQRPSASGN